MELGTGEILVILVLVLLLFGPSKLPQLGEALGKGIRAFKSATNEHDTPAEPDVRDALPPAAAVTHPEAASKEPEPSRAPKA